MEETSEGVKVDKVKELAEKIKHAVELIRDQDAEYGKSDNTELLEDVEKLNVEHDVKKIKHSRDVLATRISKGEIGIIGGMYYVESGRVEFTGDVQEG